MGFLAASNKLPTGLILSGGGARAAYQVGVLRALARLLPERAPNPFDIICGTSSGALNAAVIATEADCLQSGVNSLSEIWGNISSDTVYEPMTGNLFVSVSNLMLSILAGGSAPRASAFLDNKPLRKLLKRKLEFGRIQHNIDRGLLDAIGITASAYGTGASVSFYQAIKGTVDWTGPHRIGRRCKLGTKHLMASCAIPLLFPAVSIEGQYYCDGAVRQVSPASPALRLGARRLFVIGVSGNRSKAGSDESLTEEPSSYQVLGHIMNGAFVDTLENDLDVLRRMNRMARRRQDDQDQSTKERRNPIEFLEISPSERVNQLAVDYYEELPKGMARYIRQDSSSTMLSLILFEQGYCNRLADLGFHDAMAKEDEIREFLKV